MKKDDVVEQTKGLVWIVHNLAIHISNASVVLGMLCLSKTPSRSANLIVDSQAKNYFFLQQLSGC